MWSCLLLLFVILWVSDAVHAHTLSFLCLCPIPVLVRRAASLALIAYPPILLCFVSVSFSLFFPVTCLYSNLRRQSIDFCLQAFVETLSMTSLSSLEDKCA